jgi:hypothetical protein
MPNREMNAWMQGLGVAQELLASASARKSALPQVMQADCKVVRGKVPGPADHVLCATHGHIIDANTHMIIAHTLDEYKKLHGRSQLGSDAQGLKGGGGAAGKVTTIDEDEMTIVVGSSPTPMALPPQTPREKAEFEKRQNDAAARAKTDDARLQQRLHSPEFVDGIVSRSRVNCDHYKIMIADSCQGFTKYAEKKVKEFKQFKKAVAPFDLFGEVLKFALGQIAGRLGERVGSGISEIGSKLADDIFKKTKNSLEGAVNKIVDNLNKEDDSVEALEQAIKDINDGSSRAGTAVSNAAFDTIETRLTALADSLKKSGNPLSADDATLLKDFADGDLDAALERFGVPSAATAKANQGKILEGLVREFEKKRIPIWNAALGDYPGRSAASDVAVRQSAERYAREARQEYEDELNKDEEQQKSGRR